MNGPEPAPSAEPMDSVRGLLAGCCVSCQDAPAGGCAGKSLPPSPMISKPGSLAPSGPLAPEVLRSLTEIAGLEPTRDNRVRLLVDGTETYGAMLDLVRSARADLRFENFIFRDDTVGRAFASELRDRSVAGPDVRVLYDPFGSIMSRRLPVGRRFRHSPVRVRVYNPIRPTPAFFRQGRNHRKTVVQDGRRLVAGGICLADAWSGNCIRHCTWRDSAVLVEGSAAFEAADEFDLVWLRSTPLFRRAHGGAGIDRGADRGPARGFGAVPVRILSGHPRERRLERVLAHVFDAAREEILITNPYFLPTDDLRSSLEAAVRRGVRVEILVPGHNNHPIAGLASEHMVGPLLDGGVRIWLWPGPMIHAKTVVVDRRWSAVGSSNLDPLSLRRNVELDVEIHGSSVGDALSSIFARDRKECRPFTTQDWHRRSLLRREATRLASVFRGLL